MKDKRYLNYSEEIALFVPIFLLKGGLDVAGIRESDDYKTTTAIEDARRARQIVDALTHEFIHLAPSYDSGRKDLHICSLLTQDRKDKKYLFEMLASAYLTISGDDPEAQLRLDADTGRTALVSTNTMRVYQMAHMCRDWLGQPGEWDDLVQNGMLGLLIAIDAFIPWYGYRFGTFATWQIKGYLQKHMRFNKSYDHNLQVEIDDDQEQNIIERIRYDDEANGVFAKRKAAIFDEIADLIASLHPSTLTEDERAVLMYDLGLAHPEIDGVNIVSVRRRLRRKLSKHPEIVAFMNKLDVIDFIEEMSA